MPLSKIADARKLNDEELTTEIVALKRQLFELRLQQATRRLDKPHQFKHNRHRLAQLLTVERERQLALEENQPAVNSAQEEE
jgi:large subunit ribosomal protein L29